MIPQVFYIGPLPINSFGLMVALAFIAGSNLLARSFSLEGIDPAKAERFVFAAALSGLVGARIWFIGSAMLDGAEFSLAEIFSSGGFTFYGGFVFATFTLLFLANKDRIKISQLADTVGPALALGYAIGRLGCQLSGDGDYGIMIRHDSPLAVLGMSYAQGVVPTPPGVLVYPTPIYETFLALLILWALLKVQGSIVWRSIPWARFSLYLFLISIERFLIEFIRIEPRYGGGLSQAQYLSIVLALFGLVGLTIVYRNLMLGKK